MSEEGVQKKGRVMSRLSREAQPRYIQAWAKAGNKEGEGVDQTTFDRIS